jgi:hypothetical protein
MSHVSISRLTTLAVDPIQKEKNQKKSQIMRFRLFAIGKTAQAALEHSQAQTMEEEPNVTETENFVCRTCRRHQPRHGLARAGR